MICLLGLLVFSVLGIFSATHRKLAAEAFDCVFRKVTLRKCQSGLDTRLKSHITGLFMKFTPRVGRFVFKWFEVLSWIFTLLFIWSLVSVSIGGYNFWVYGNCNGANAQGFCVFDPTGSNTGFSGVEEQCVPPELQQSLLTLEGVDQGMFLLAREGTNDTVLFIGCYGCEYTRKAYPVVKGLVEKENTTLIFAHFPVKDDTIHLTPYVNCLYQREPGKLMALNDLLFSVPAEELGENSTILETLEGIGANVSDILACAQQPAERVWADAQREEIEKTGIYGTPLVFVNGEPIVGPRPYRVYRRMLR